ncbi:recombinase family protein [Clostridium sp. AF35-15]|jgi:DNA invertase Pin-like site-specific DNA recombinase|uniref:recombinase family protein n=1 Tax=Clostridium sp. AF35-15 TaxID=2293013 RepID=UPI000E4D8B28|nr:recombinase family protein [Clostridium sp. AF35-15]RHP15133.1 recombinase family protein [Clostridium sp. AF35-15]
MRIKVIKPTKAVHQQKKKVCAYVRVSTDSLQQEDSLENQTTYFKGFITANPEWEFVGIYSDQGISGYKENRPGFQKMIEDARAGNIDLIVVKSISRFARNTETVLKFTRELKSIGVGIFFEIQNINTLSGAGELMLTILAAFAQAESEGASANAKMTYKRKFESGIPAHGLESTFGYKANAQGDIVVDEEKAAVVRQMFDLAEQGIWPSKIKQYLNKNGVPGCAGGDWDDTAVFRVLHNVSYKGDLILQKTYRDSRRKQRKNEGQVDQWYIAENHQPIVPPKQWDKVQEILRKRSEHLQKPAPPKPDKPRSSRNTYPLSNLIYCPICGEKLIHKWGKGKNEYWACKTNLKVGKDACKGIWLPAEVANDWGEITEPIVAVQYEDEYGMRRFTAYPKDEYDAFKRED